MVITHKKNKSLKKIIQILKCLFLTKLKMMKNNNIYFSLLIYIMSENFVEMENVENVENVENQPIKPTKKPITELKRQQLIKAREAAHIKKQEIKELNLKSKNLKLEESKLKAFQYDELMKKKEEIIKS